MKANVRMSQLTRGLLAVAIVGSGLAVVHQDAVAAISAGRHNLSTGGSAAAGNRITAISNTNAEICVFCHTPHGADVNVAGAPLWNKRFTNPTGAFTPYVTTPTLDSNFATDGITGSTFLSGASLACLSCHDGTQAIDNLLNAPGSGNVDSTGGNSDGRTWGWTAGSNTNIDSNGYLQSGANLGKDLSNDHPIGIRYCGGGPMVTNPTGVCQDVDFVSAKYAVIGSTTQFWVDTTGNGFTGVADTREKTDMLLYNRGFPATASVGAGLAPSVECASCHDVHSSQALFLRMTSNVSSQVCLACHIK